MDFDLDASAPGSLSAEDVASVAAPEPVAAAEPVAATPAPEKPAEPVTPEPKPEVDDSEKVIELSRARRDAETRATGATKERDEAKAEQERLAPMKELFALAETEPVQFIAEIADVVGLDPNRVLQIMAGKAVDGEAELTPEDKIARLEKQIAELKTQPEEEPEEDTSTTEQTHLDGISAIVEAAPESFPNCAAEPEAASRAAFLLLVRHWKANGEKPDYKPMSYGAALKSTEAALRSMRPVSTPPPEAPASTGGLHQQPEAALPPETDRVQSDEEIKAEMLRMLGR